MKKREKDAIINRLLYVAIFSIIASIVLWFIYNGYLHTAYVLAMPKLMIAFFIISLVLAGVLGWRAFIVKTNKHSNSLSKFSPYLILFILIALSSIAIYLYTLYAIYALWILIAVYLIIMFGYNLYKLAKG